MTMVKAAPRNENSTEDSASKSLDERYVPLHAHLVSPLHQGTFPELVSATRYGKYQNLAFINTMTVFTGSGFADVPIVSGSSIRGRLRRHAVAIVLKELRGAGAGELPTVGELQNLNRNLRPAERFLIQLLLAGGSLSAKGHKPAAVEEAFGSESPEGPDGAKAPDEPAGTTEDNGSVAFETEDGLKVEIRTHRDGTKTKTRFEADGTQTVTTQVPYLNQTLSRAKLETALPVLRLFGYADGDNHLTPGRVAMTNLYPLLEETQLLLSDFAPLSGLSVIKAAGPVGSWAELTKRGYPQASRVRTDSSLRYFEQGEFAAAAKDDVGNTTQAIAHFEYVPPPMDFVGAIVLDPDAGDDLRGLIYLALERLENDGYLGGQHAAGYGQVLWPESVRERADYQQATGAFRDTMRARASEVAEALHDVVALKDKTEKIDPNKKNKRGGR